MPEPDSIRCGGCYGHFATLKAFREHDCRPAKSVVSTRDVQQASPVERAREAPGAGD